MKAVIAVIAFAFAFPVQAESPEIKVVTQGAFRGILPTLASVFERASEHKVTCSVFTPGVLKERLLKGEAATLHS